MNLYITSLKAQQIRQAQSDFGHIPYYDMFTPKNFFYFFKHDGMKFIHKESLRLCYTNGDTYSEEIDTPNYCCIDADRNIKVPELTFMNPLMPELMVDTEKFYIMDYVQGDACTDITEDEFFYLKNNRDFGGFTPFYNSMAFNLVRSPQGLKLIDMKHFEPIDEKPFFIYMYNKKFQINTLYVEQGTDLSSVLNHLNRDYPVRRIIVYKEK